MILDNSYDRFESREKYNTIRSSYYVNESGWVGKERSEEERKGEERKGKERRGKERKGEERKGVLRCNRIIISYEIIV